MINLDHIRELPEVRLYLDSGKHNFMLHGGFGIRYIRESNADAALAAADREVGRLKCCGNCAVEDCRSWSGEDGPFPYTYSHCQFLPSRWVARDKLREVTRDRDIAQAALALLETALPSDVEHAVTLAEESFPSDRVEESCSRCIHFLSAFDTCSIGPVETCNRWMPGSKCRLTPTQFRALPAVKP